ncbi:MAG: hypothetical protein LBU65_10295 [Planctomycetaceae bacterium]|jgi:hypothetical protein|nr:hypothetical protein [Planctomycetaceae bacterium]
MYKSLSNFVSFGGYHFVAAVGWFGMALFLLGIAPEQYGQSESEEKECYYTYTWVDEGGTHSEVRAGCQEGYSCCTTSGECIEVSTD